MRIGLLGLPGSGKTTVFNALTKMQVPMEGRPRSRNEPNVAVARVLDERVGLLSELYAPRKTVYATVEFVDSPGLGAEAPGQAPFPAAAMAMIRTMDALALVVRNFDDPRLGNPSPPADLQELSDELVLQDLIVAEGRLERIEHGYLRGQRSETLLREEKTLRRVLEQLNRNRPIRELALSCEEDKIIRGFQFLTRKPVMAVLNSHEAAFGRNGAVLAAVGEHCRAVEFAGKFEMELGLLDEAEAQLFMEDLGIRESAQRRLTRLAYETLGYISFFTVGADEVRAWNLHQGGTALDAAAAIHSDLARGFIRAECFSYEHCLNCGSERAIREAGLFRLEGRDYRVQDGDILNIRFNV